METDPQLLKRMDRLRIRDTDLVERYIRGSGPGGQKINKTASCVYLKHLPSGIEIKCQQERSRDLNRQLARQHLCEALERRRRRTEQRRRQAAAKRRFKNRKPSPAATERRLTAKRRRSNQKQLRRNPGSDE